MRRFTHWYKRVSDPSVMGAVVLPGLGILDSTSNREDMANTCRRMYEPHPCVIAYDGSEMKKSPEYRKPDILHKTSSDL